MKTRFARISGWLLGLWRRPLFWVLFLPFFAAVLWLLYDWVLFDRTIRISKETTFVTGPLDAAGNVDFELALNEHLREGVTPENNAAIDVLHAFGPKVVPEIGRDRYYRWLGIDPLPENGDYFHGLFEGETDYIDKVVQTKRSILSRPWSEEEFPEAAAWLRANRKSVEAARSAAQKTQFYVPMLGVTEWDFVEPSIEFLQAVRTLNRLLDADAMFEMQRGNWAQAVENVVAIRQLGLLMMKRGSSSQWNIGTACLSIQLGLQVDLCRYASSEDRAALIVALRAQNSWDFTRGIDATPTTQRILSVVRLLQLAGALTPGSQLLKATEREAEFKKQLYQAQPWPVLQQYRQNNPDLSPLQNLYQRQINQLSYTSLNWNDVLITMHAALDEEELIGRIPDPVQREKRLTDFYKSLKKGYANFGLSTLRSRAARTAFAASALTSYRLCNWQTVENTEQRHTIGRDLATVMYALEEFDLKHGKYPQELGELVPEFIGQLPKDPYADGPFKYLPSEGGYTLYSVGWDGKDDAGKPSGVDIAIQMSRND